MSHTVDPNKPRRVAYDKSRASNVQYLKTYWNNVDYAITETNDNPMVLFDEIQQHMHVALGDRGSPFGQVFFGQLPRLVLTVFERDFPVEAWLERANAFVSEIMSLMITLIQEECPMTAFHIQALEPIFQKDNRYYRCHGVDDDVYDKKRAEYYPVEGKEAFAVIQPGDDDTSVRFVKNLREFGELGGFDIVFDRLVKDATKDKVQSKLLADYLKLVEMLVEDLSVPFRTTYIQNVHTKITDFVEKLSNDELRKVSLDDVVSSLDNLSELAAKAQLKSLCEEVEKFKLSTALKFVQLPFLEASLKGIEQIISMICAATGDQSYSMARKQTNSRYQGFGNTSGGWVSASSYPGGAQITVVGTSGAAMSDDEEEKIITPKLLLDWVKDNDIIAVIFKLNHHEALRRCTQIVRFIAVEETLSTETLDTIWKASHLHESLQKEVFALIEELLGAIPAEQIDYLYSKIKDLPPSAYNNQVLTFIMNFTKEAIKVQLARKEEEKPYGLALFWSLLSAADSPDAPAEAVLDEACGHLIELLAEYPAQREIFTERCVNNLKSGTIVAISLRLLTNIVRSSKTISKDIQEMEEKFKLIDSILGVLHTKDSAAIGVAAQLSFLEVILTESSLTISSEQATTLWDSLVSAGQPDAAFNWLETVQYSHLHQDPYSDAPPRFPALAPDVVGNLFSTKMAALPLEAFSVAGIKVFIRSFASVNSRLKKLRRLGEREFNVRDVELEGADRIWEVALNARDRSVAAVAVKFLGVLYAKVTRKAANSMREKRIVYAKMCIDSLLDAAKSFSAASGEDAAFYEQKMGRCVHLLKVLVEQDTKAARREVTRAQERGEAAPTSTRVGAVLSKEYFQSLFDLLSRPEIRDGAWSILNLIPANVNIADPVNELSVDGGDLVFAKNLASQSADESLYLFHLLYLLQIVKEQVKDEQWRKKCIAQGGVKVFVSIFTTKDLLKIPCGEYGRIASGLLVEVINVLFTCGDMEADSLTSSLDGTFIHRLMEQIKALGLQQAAAPTSAVEEEEEEEETTSTATKKGTRMANCWYSGETKQFTFGTGGAKNYRIALYCVDYNTNSRVQHLTAFVGNNMTKSDAPEGDEHTVELRGEEFHNGQWVLYDVHTEGEFNVIIDSKQGPNWVLSAVLLDKSPVPPPAEIPATGVTFAGVDSKSQGKWRERYGSCGGVLLGKKDFRVPTRPDVGPDAPSLEDYLCVGGCDKYAWVRALTNDARAMQQVPHEDELDYFSGEDDDDVADVSCDEDEGGEGVDGAGSSALVEMLTAIVSSHEPLRASFFSYPNVDEWLFSSLILCPDKAIRAGVAEGVRQLATNDKDGSSCANFAKILVGFLNRLAEADGQTETERCPSFEQYFHLMMDMLKLAPAAVGDPAALFERLMDCIDKRDVLEDDDEPLRTDSTLVGLLLLGASVLTVFPKLTVPLEFVRDTFRQCLFGAPSARVGVPNLPKCKTANAREAAFDLLTCIANSSGYTASAAQAMITDSVKEYLENGIDLPTERDISIALTQNASADAAEGRETRGRYVGLKNQGCTCYINATLQQLFIIPHLRKDILNVTVQLDEAEAPPPPAEGAPEGEEIVPADPAKTNIMYQLQTLFAYMQEGKHSYVDTIDFCNTIRMHGDPINMRIQEDANEFFNNVTDQLEGKIKGQPEVAMFRDTFGGTFAHQLRKECEHSSSREEAFLTISCKVQSKRSLQESFDFFVESDEVEYTCDECAEAELEKRIAAGKPPAEDEKIRVAVGAKKNQVIKHLPNILALHLIRFEFDFNTLQETKVDDRFEFPDTLNMKPYTVEGMAAADGLEVEEEWNRPDDYYEYELSGVLVHSGSANAGHYYSYIRERDSITGELKPEWYEFNDRFVTPFNAQEDLDDMTFGGKYEMSTHMKYYSAYMLFYDRKVKYPANVYTNTPLSSGLQRETTEVEPQILNTIWQESVRACHQRRLMTKACLDFMWRSIMEGPCVITPCTEVRTMSTAECGSAFGKRLQLGAKFVCDVLIHVDDTVENGLNIVKRIADLRALFEQHTPACVWMLSLVADPNCLWMRKALMLTSDLDVRVAMAEFFVALMSKVAPAEREFYIPADEGTANAEADADPTLRSPSCVVRFINSLVALLHQSALKPQFKLTQLLWTLHEFAKFGRDERNVLLRKQAVTDLKMLYESRSRYTSYASPHPNANLDLVALIALLVTGCDNPEHAEARGQGVPGIPPETGLTLDNATLKAVFQTTFLTSLMRQKSFIPILETIFAHWCYGHPELSTAVSEVALTMASRNTSEIRALYWRVVTNLLYLDDKVHVHRVEAIASKTTGCIISSIALAHYRDGFLRFLMDCAQKFPAVLEFLTTDGRWGSICRAYQVVRAWIEKNDLERYTQLFEPAFGPLSELKPVAK